MKNDRDDQTEQLKLKEDQSNGANKDFVSFQALPTSRSSVNPTPTVFTPTRLTASISSSVPPAKPSSKFADLAPHTTHKSRAVTCPSTCPDAAKCIHKIIFRNFYNKYSIKKCCAAFFSYLFFTSLLLLFSSVVKNALFLLQFCCIDMYIVSI